VEDERSGALGCGCALVPGLVLGVLIFALVGLVGRPPAPAIVSQTNPGPARVSVALSEEYMGRLVHASLGGGPLEGLEVDASPGNKLAVRGQVTVSVLGRDVGLPISFGFSVRLQDGRITLDLVDSELPGGMDEAQATGLVRPFLARIAGNLQRELERALGPGWRVEDIVTDEESVILLLAGWGSEE
jgi:hypothetical protein